MSLIAVVLVFATVTHANDPAWLLATLHLAFLAVGSWVAHDRLAADAPDPRHVAEFYVWVAIGGVGGTLVAGVLAPELLPDLWEYPAVIALACLPRKKEGVIVDDGPLRTDLIHVAVVAALVMLTALLVPALGLTDPRLITVASFGPGALYAYRWMPFRRRFSLSLLAIVLTAGLTQQHGETLLSTRSFFGVIRVLNQGPHRYISHGSTVHGGQRIDQRDGCEPLAYFDRAGPLGSVFEARHALDRHGRTVVIGLGAGAIACYAAPAEPWRFIEINPDVVAVAREPRFFTFLANSPSSDLETTVGDGRIEVQREQDGALSLLIVDAFNSDSVPVHLLTREAIHLYTDKLEPDGWLVLHLSNRILNLRQVAADVVAAEGLSAVYVSDSYAAYAVIAQDAESLRGLDAQRWAPLDEGVAEDAWTDAFSSVWDALSMRGTTATDRAAR